MSADERVLDLCDMSYESAQQTVEYIDRLNAELAKTRAAGDALADAVEDNDLHLSVSPKVRRDAVQRLLHCFEDWRSVRGDVKTTPSRTLTQAVGDLLDTISEHVHGQGNTDELAADAERVRIALNTAESAAFTQADGNTTDVG